jgi:predicted amidohydrolase YtcJ
MRSAFPTMLAIALLIASPFSSAFAQQTPPDLILFNGRVFTSNASQPYVEALAIRGERIFAVGTSKEIVTLAGKETHRIDLRGHTVIPGINDAHDHLVVGPKTYELPIKTMDPQWKEITEALSSAVATAPKGAWITATFGTTLLDDPEATRSVLDRLAPDNPVLLRDLTWHAALLNTRALEKLGFSEGEPNPEGGIFVRNPADGGQTGMAFQFASFQVARRFSELATQHEAEQQLSQFFDQAARWGITTVQDMASPITQKGCADLLARVPPPIRVRIMWFGLTDQHGRLTKEDRATSLHPAPLVTASGTKWVLDGTPVERSAAMRKPYTDRPETSGTLDFSQKEIEDILRESLQSHEQLMLHVVGDRTTEVLLGAMDATGGKDVWSKRRVRIEHGDGITPDLMPHTRELGLVVVVNPGHLALPDLFTKRFGADRAARLLPLRSLVDAGIPIAIGSDGPINPYLNIMLAATDPERPTEAITREQAVIAYTRGSAYAEFSDKDKGTLEPGKLADLAVLSQDIFQIPLQDLPKTESVLTLVGGKVVYDTKVLGAR